MTEAATTLTKETKLRMMGQYLFQPIKCLNPFQGNQHSKDSFGKLILSPSILADMHEGTFQPHDFRLLLTPLHLITKEHVRALAKRLIDEEQEFETIYAIAEGGLHHWPLFILTERHSPTGYAYIEISGSDSSIEVGNIDPKSQSEREQVFTDASSFMMAYDTLRHWGYHVHYMETNYFETNLAIDKTKEP